MWLNYLKKFGSSADNTVPPRNLDDLNTIPSNKLSDSLDASNVKPQKSNSISDSGTNPTTTPNNNGFFNKFATGATLVATGAGVLTPLLSDYNILRNLFGGNNNNTNLLQQTAAGLNYQQYYQPSQSNFGQSSFLSPYAGGGGVNNFQTSPLSYFPNPIAPQAAISSPIPLFPNNNMPQLNQAEIPNADNFGIGFKSTTNLNPLVDIPSGKTSSNLEPIDLPNSSYLQLGSIHDGLLTPPLF